MPGALRLTVTGFAALQVSSFGRLATACQTRTLAEQLQVLLIANTLSLRATTVRSFRMRAGRREPAHEALMSTTVTRSAARVIAV